PFLDQDRVDLVRGPLDRVAAELEGEDPLSQPDGLARLEVEGDRAAQFQLPRRLAQEVNGPGHFCGAGEVEPVGARRRALLAVWGAGEGVACPAAHVGPGERVVGALVAAVDVAERLRRPQLAGVAEAEDLRRGDPVPAPRAGEPRDALPAD